AGRASWPARRRRRGGALSGQRRRRVRDRADARARRRWARPVPAAPTGGEDRMKVRVLMEPRHGATYDRIVAMAKATEEAGFDAFFRSDHYLGIDATDPDY